MEAAPTGAVFVCGFKCLRYAGRLLSASTARSQYARLPERLSLWPFRLLSHASTVGEQPKLRRALLGLPTGRCGADCVGQRWPSASPSSRHSPKVRQVVMALLKTGPNGLHKKQIALAGEPIRAFRNTCNVLRHPNEEGRLPAPFCQSRSLPPLAPPPPPPREVCWWSMSLVFPPAPPPPSAGPSVAPPALLPPRPPA